MQSVKRFGSVLITAAVILESAGQAWAAESDAFAFFQEEAKVTTASRREQSIAEIPLAVDVITREEIHASGAVNLWDLLRFRVGMDVLDARSGSGNRAVVSERGFPHEYAGNLLVLVDGRSVYNAFAGGAQWEEIPVSMQDIDRIEIIRGPSTALYGTGAGVGVVNIMTKKPDGKAALELDNRGGNLGTVQSYQGMDAALKSVKLRVSHTFQEVGRFPTAADRNVQADDFLQKNVVNLRADIPVSERSNMEVLGGGSWETMGLGGAGAASRGDMDTDFQTLKYAYRSSEDSSIEASSSRNDFISDAPSGNLAHDLRTLQYDYEVLHRFAWWDKRLSTTYGTSYRNTQVTSVSLFNAACRAPRIEIYRGYLQQGIQFTEKLSLQGAVSLEASNVAGIKPNYQIAPVFAITPNHALRASYSLAYTLHDFFPSFGNWGGFVFGSPQVASNPYKIKSTEAGYYGTFLDKRLQTDISLFYTKINNNHQSFFDWTTYTLVFRNYDDAIARGAEVNLKYRISKSQWVFANYTYEHISDTAGDQGFITDNVPAHKVNFGGSTILGYGISATVNVGYKDAYFISTSGRFPEIPVAPYWRVDARLGYVLPWINNAEAYVAAQNLLMPTHLEFPDGLSVPRTYQGGISVKFGGAK